MADPLSVLLIAVGLMALALINVYGIWLLRRHGAFARFVPVNELRAVVPMHDPRGLHVLAKAFHNADYLQLLKEVMNSVSKCEPGPSTDVLAVFDHVLRGGGLLCSGMANLYFNVLRLNGITARQIYLSRACFDSNDTHVTVEVLIDRNWVIADPTFHVGFERNGQLVGAQAISESLRDGSFDEIKPRYYGPVNYPPRLESYYTHWLSLFNNVYIPDSDQPSRSLWARLPPLRYWCGPVMYFQQDPAVSYDHLKFQDRLYLLFVVFLPMTLIAIVSIILVGLLLR